MPTEYSILLIFVFGMLGGLVNAVLTVQGLILPNRERLANESYVWRPGFLGNVLIGGVAGIVLAGLYSPLAAVDIGAVRTANLHLTIGSLAGAILSGIGGARLLTQEVDKRYNELAKGDLASVSERVLDLMKDALAAGEQNAGRETKP